MPRRLLRPNQLGADAFKDIDLSDPDSEPPAALEDEFVATALKAAEECGIDFSPDETTTTTAGSSDGGDGTYGSDPTLDALWDDCDAGDYQACDDLYNESPSGSEYEDFGDTCGDRNEPQGYCVDVYGDGSETTETTESSSDTTIDGLLSRTSRSSSRTPTRAPSTSAGTRPSAWPTRWPSPSRTARSARTRSCPTS